MESEINIAIIAALDNNRGIGKDNKIPWHIPEDLKRFKRLTTGHPIIMGRKTYESIGRALPDRTDIVISRDKNFKAEGCQVVGSVEEGLRLALSEIEGLAQPDDELFIIGGGQIYQQALPLTDRLYLTLVDGSFNADTFFPDYNEFNKIISEENGESEGLKYKFLVLERS